MNIEVKSGQTWENSKRVLQIQTNGTPTSFNVAEFSLPDLKISLAEQMDTDRLCEHIHSNGFGLSEKRIFLK